MIVELKKNKFLSVLANICLQACVEQNLLKFSSVKLKVYMLHVFALVLSKLTNNGVTVAHMVEWVAILLKGWRIQFRLLQVPVVVVSLL